MTLRQFGLRRGMPRVLAQQQASQWVHGPEMDASKSYSLTPPFRPGRAPGSAPE